METIYALSSGGVPAGIAVIRISGPRCRFVLETMIGAVPEPRRASLRSIRDGDGSEIDRGLVLWFPGPASFTGEDMVEFQVHGSRAVVRALRRRLDEVGGLVPAEPGEFTRRAFLAGRIDLTEAEGLADLLAAETESQRRQAATQAGGALRRLYGGWRERLIRIRALVEAEFDFAEEEDVPGSVAEEAWRDAGRLREEIVSHLAAAVQGERVRAGLQVVLLGHPNAGKSSLLNALAERDVAIVTEEAGTTRDLIEVHLDLGGWAVTVVDTAGLRIDAGRVEAEGIRRAIERGRAADLILWLRAPDDPGEAPAKMEIGGTEVWEVATKLDLLPERKAGRAEKRFESATEVFALSTVTGAGLGDLIGALRERVSSAGGAAGDIVPSRERHRNLLSRVVAELDRALDNGRVEAELRSEDLRRAGDELGRITGEIGVEDLLDVIFREFCIGK
ncbi:MAG: tRNA uridine-5-carboxymethylaminomethyl(34) synthesis GTPase MnmE [Siculibacillus sp.]|nr:tRNA uridine-5-carboxymethylaminomethyl(34) synthesis GTPase MnmE [Siculibacillus sp.]